MAENPLADPDIVRAARYMIARNGRQAALRAHGRATELVIRGEHGAAYLWGQITKAIQAIEEEGES